MNKLILPILLIIGVLLVSGCTQTQLSLNQTLSNIGQVNSFLKQYPNATIQSVLLSTVPQNLVTQICGTNMPLSNVYFVNITGSQQNLLLLLNSTNGQPQCLKLLNPQILQKPANGTANIQITASSGQGIGSVAIGNSVTQFQFNGPSNLTTNIATSVQTTLTNPTSISTGLNGTNLTIVVQQGNLVQSIPTNIQVAAPKVLSPNQITTTAQPSPTGKLKSNYFGSDPIALGIANGSLINYKFSDLYAGTTSIFDINPDKFQYKILSALRMLGYSLETRLKKPHLIVWSEAFQKTHSLPVTDNITSDFMVALDKDIYDLEQKIQPYVNSFPIPAGDYTVDIPSKSGTAHYDVTFVPNHKNEPPADYVRFYYSYLMSTLPRNIAPLTKESIHELFMWQAMGVVYYDNGWKLNYIPTAQPLNRQNSGLFTATWHSVIAVPSEHFYHEYGHQIDSLVYGQFAPNSGMINTTGFYNIIFDLNDCSVYAGWKRCAVKPNAKVVSDYSLSWEDPNNPGHYSIAEAFAEAFAMYIQHGNLYRELANIDSNYKEQYDWLKANVFSGVEYCTGDKNLISSQQPLWLLWDYRKNLIPSNTGDISKKLMRQKVDINNPIYSIFDEVVQCQSNIAIPPPGGTIQQPVNGTPGQTTGNVTSSNQTSGNQTSGGTNTTTQSNQTI